MNVYKFIEKYSIMDNRKREIVKFGLEMIRMLLISGIISGAFTGLCAQLVLMRLQKQDKF